MFHLPRLLVLLLVLTFALRAEARLEPVQHAQSLLGGEIWSRIIRIENESRSRRYPRIVHALVFELAGLLWFYTPTDGTQSFSLHRGQLEREKTDFGPLLRDIDPGFVRWSAIPAAARPPSGAAVGALPNGCFIESIVTLRERFANGVPIREPRLLSYYLPQGSGLAGHTVLAYATRDEVEVSDPSRPGERFVFGSSFGPDALALARALEGNDVVKARYIPLELPNVRPAIAAAAVEVEARRHGPGRS